MKNLLILLSLLILMVACKHSSQKKTANSKLIKAAEKDTIFPGDNDTVVIDSENRYKLTKRELMKLYKQEPTLSFHDGHYPDAPEIAYHIRQIPDFGSEAGQDLYYAIYAHFLKKKHPSKKSAVRRQTLIKIYRDINHVFGRLAQGGTYFGHQYTRILGDAEYSISLGEYRDCDDERTFDINKQKELYLTTLKQQITDELSNDYEFLEKEKLKVKKELFETVNELDGLITDYFYLESTRTFQYSNY